MITRIISQRIGRAKWKSQNEHEHNTGACLYERKNNDASNDSRTAIMETLRLGLKSVQQL